MAIRKFRKKDGKRVQISGPPVEEKKRRTSADIKRGRNVPVETTRKKTVTTLPTIEAKRDKKRSISGRIAGVGLESAMGRKTLPIPFQKLEKDIESKADTAALSETPTGKALGIANLAAELIGAGFAGTLLKLGAGAASGARGVITRTASGGNLAKQFGVKSITTQRGFTGKSSTFALDKVFHTTKPVAQRFATNAKSKGLTTKLLIAAGLTLGGASIARDIIGTYPFAAFGKEEALQATGIPIWKLTEAGEFDKAQELLDWSNELIDTVPSKIPYKNVLQEFEKYVDAQRKANEGWQVIIDAAREEAATGESDFAREREASDEAARQRQLEERERDSEYFALIREGKFEEAEELLQSELKGGENNG